MIRILAHACIAGGLTIWVDLARGMTFNADQLIGLTCLLTAGCLIADELIRRFNPRRTQQSAFASEEFIFEEVDNGQ